MKRILSWVLGFALLGLASSAPAQAPKVAVYGANSASWNAEVRAKIAGTGLFSQVDAYDATSATPTLVQLQAYKAVLVYSDDCFNDAAAWGNVLADYVDGGGGVVVATFAFWQPGSCLGMEGRLSSGGYLPFTQGQQSQGTRLTLVADLPAHPILLGVASLDGGSSSYHNNPVSIAAGATLIAHWTNGQPLVGAKTFASGRVAGLNFYPPSTDSRGDFWVATTDGARLMANALLWAGGGVITYDTSFLDDLGTCRVCFNSTTGDFLWTVLKGVKSGAQYKGKANITTTPMGLGLSTPAGVVPSLSLSWNRALGNAWAFLSTTDYGGYLRDRNTYDDPPSPCVTAPGILPPANPEN